VEILTGNLTAKAPFHRLLEQPIRLKLRIGRSGSHPRRRSILSQGLARPRDSYRPSNSLAAECSSIHRSSLEGMGFLAPGPAGMYQQTHPHGLFGPLVTPVSFEVEVGDCTPPRDYHYHYTGSRVNLQLLPVAPRMCQGVPRAHRDGGARAWPTHCAVWPRSAASVVTATAWTARARQDNSWPK
jgi:hypothetical protein